MKDIKSISKELWRIILRLFFLLCQLSRQVILPNRRRKGNLLNTLFLFYIGFIESIQHFEHRQFKLSELFQNKLVRRGLMVFSFLLFLLTSFEQPLAVHSPVNEPGKVQCSSQNISTGSAYECTTRLVSSKVECFSPSIVEDDQGSYWVPSRIPSKLYLRNHRLLI